MLRISVTIIICCTLAIPALFAQEGEAVYAAPTPTDAYAESSLERHDFDEKKWESLKKGIDYSMTRKPEKEKEPEKKRAAPKTQSPSGFASAMKILAIVLGVALLALLIVKMAGDGNLFGPKNSKVAPAVSASELEKIEENLHEAELTDPIQRAVAAGDYPLAVRLYYLAVLKELSLRSHIRWKRDKTNGAYLRELAGSPLFGMVQEVTLIFERIWYGKVELSAEDFMQLETKLKQAVATASA